MFDLTVQCECHCNVSQDASNLKHRKTEIVTFSSSRWTIVVLPDNLLSMMSNRDPTDKPEKHHWHLEFCSKVHILFLSQSKHIWHQDVLSKARHYRAALCDFWSMPLKSVCAHMWITCTSQLLAADTPPQPAEPPAGTRTDTPLSPPQSSESGSAQEQMHRH